jgi:cyclic pyranopterin phosphate synthase
MQAGFTHVDDLGQIRMVDVTRKHPTLRRAHASCIVCTDVDLSTLTARADEVDFIEAARLAGIQAAKQTARLIPLCHPLTLHAIDVEVAPRPSGIEVSAIVAAIGQTGVEMEALTACAFAALSVMSAIVGRDPNAQIDDLALMHKSGGESGDWGRMVDPPR